MFKSFNKEIVIFTGNKIENNSYLLIKNKNCIIIDPSWYSKELDKYIRDNGLSLKGIILTHGHYDHIAECEYLLNKYKTFAYVNSLEKEVFESYNMASSFNVNNFKPPKNTKYFNESNVNIDNFNLEIIQTPGHTCGGICIKYKNYLFTGDTIFANSIGRMDLPTGNPRQLLNSISIIKNMNKDLLIFPGHDKFGINLNELVKTNPYIK